MNNSKQSEGLIVFDFDGVLNLNSTQAYYEVYSQTLSDLDVQIPHETETQRIQSMWGASQSEILRELLVDTPASLREANRRYKENLSEMFPELIRPVPGAAETLGQLATRYTLAINSAADRAVLIDKVMPRLGISRQLFAQIVTADDLLDPNKAKPDPYALNMIMERLEFTPRQTIMVGDSASDVLTAHFSGSEPIVTLTGNLSREEAENLGVDHIIDDVTHIEKSLGLLGLKYSQAN